MTHTYNISGMTCGGCQAEVKRILSKVAGIKKVDIDLAGGTADIEMDKHVSTETLKKAIKINPKFELSEHSPVEAMPAYMDMANEKSWLATYKPILVIFAYIVVLSFFLAGSPGSFNVAYFMRIFMSGFFLTFSFFKMLDLQGFANSYSMYDIVAKRFKQWGYMYAFIELGLGIAYALNFQPVIVSYITLVVMSVSIIGVLQSVLNKRKIQCACLGAVFNLPMSTITIIEDALMIAMSAGMLFVMQ